MITAANMLRAILEDPAADDLRLIYADWLEDHDEPARGEFIRLQVQYANHGGCWLYGAFPDGSPANCRKCPGCQEQKSLAEQAWFLLCDHHHWFDLGDNWDQFIVSRILAVSHALIWHRGFVQEVRCALADWEQHGPTLVAAHPIEAVVLTDRSPFVPERSETAIWRWDWWEVARGSGGAGSNVLSLPIWNMLQGGRKETPAGMWYPTEALANAASSNAALNWARSQIEPPLPPLPMKE